MPPRTPQNKTLNAKLTSNPPKSELQSLENLDNSKKPEPTEPNKLRIGQETFDLNEPWFDEEDEHHVTEVKEVVEKERDEIVVKEVDEKNGSGRGRGRGRGGGGGEKKKQKEFEVFVGGLDRDAVEEDLEKVFKKIGQVVEVRLVKNRYSQKNKGFAFVRFATIEQAKRAAAELNYTQVRGKVCEVTRNNDNETLHLGNICTTWTKDMLEEKLQPYELENLDDVHLIEDPRDRRKNRGYAFLNFNTHMDAVAACNKLQKESPYLGTEMRADVAFAKSAVEPDDEIMAQVKSVFLDGLPPSWDELQVQQLFERYGVIENVQLARNMPSAKRRDFGFISFRTREAAMTCIDSVNNNGIGEGSQKVLVKATLRKPLQRRMSSTTGGWRGFSTDNYDDWSAGRPYSSRQNRTVDSFGRGRGRDHRTSSYYRYSTRKDVYESESPPVEKYGGRSYSTRDMYEEELSPVKEYRSQYRRGAVRQVPSTSHSRSRGPYFESSSSSRLPSRNYEDLPSYSRVSSRGQYDDDSYDLQYEYYEDDPTDTYDYPTPSRMKRPYSAVDNDRFVRRSMARRSRSGELDLEMDAYPVRGASSYEEYSRSMPDARYGCDRVGYERRYSSGRGAPRSYDY